MNRLCSFVYLGISYKCNHTLGNLLWLASFLWPDFKIQHTSLPHCICGWRVFPCIALLQEPAIIDLHGTGYLTQKATRWRQSLNSVQITPMSRVVLVSSNPSFLMMYTHEGCSWWLKCHPWEIHRLLSSCHCGHLGEWTKGSELFVVMHMSLK